jgi:hypothetical protein
MKSFACLIAALTLACAAHAASLTGKWKMTANAPDGQTYVVDLVLQQDGTKLAGKLISDRGEMPLSSVAATADQLTFTLELGSGPIPFKLKIDGDTLKGTLATPDGTTGTVTATRDGEKPAASVSGKWTVTSKDAGGTVLKLTLVLAQTGDQLTGDVELENGDTAPISDGKVKAGEISFKITAPEGDYTVSGTVTGNQLKGSYKTPNGVHGTFSGQK